MAMGEIETENGAVVRLEADASPFMAALDRAREHTQGWAGKIQSAVGAISDFSTEKLASWADKTKAVAGLTSEQVGQALGGGIGLGLGTFFGGPVGATIGAQVGALIGDQAGSSINLSPIAAKASELFEALKPLAEEVSVSFDIVKNDVVDTATAIGSAWEGVALKDVWRGFVQGSQESLDKIKTAWAVTAAEISGYFARSMDRLREMIDKVWAAIKEPIATVASGFQTLLEKIGLVDQGTQDWGESIRAVEDAGTQVIASIGYGVGYLEGILKKAAGYFGEYIAAPMALVVAEVTDFLGDLALVASEAAKPVVEVIASAIGYLEGLLKKFAGYVMEYLVIPITQGLGSAFEMLGTMAESLASILPSSLSGPVKSIAEGLKNSGSSIKATQQQMLDDARKLQAADPAKLAKERSEGAGEGVKNFLKGASESLDATAENLRKKQQEIVEESRKMQGIDIEGQARQRQQDALDLLKRGAEERAVRDRRTEETPAEPTPEAAPDALAGVTALVAASREANNAILRASGQQQDNAADRAAAAAEANVAKQEQVAANINQLNIDGGARHRDLIDQFERLNKNLEDAALVKAV